MKKAVIGCLVLVAVLAVGAAVASYVVYRKVSTTMSGFAELATIPELDRSVRNQAATCRPRPAKSPSRSSSASSECRAPCALAWANAPANSSATMRRCWRKTARPWSMYRSSSAHTVTLPRATWPRSGYRCRPSTMPGSRSTSIGGCAPAHTRRSAYR